MLWGHRRIVGWDEEVGEGFTSDDNAAIRLVAGAAYEVFAKRLRIAP